METGNKFLSCDWGTSSFRLKLAEATTLKIITEESSKDGIANTFGLWGKSGKPEKDRFGFYFSVIRDNLKRLEKKLGCSLENVPFVISGMASSSIGMKELPYKEFPFSIDGSDLKTEIVKAGDDFKHVTLLISGAKTENDVMRGEETQLVGCLFDAGGGEQLFIHPGTHSKHVKIKNGKAVSFKTYMTGEYFSLLSGKSILSGSVEKSEDINNPNHIRAFEKGVKEGLNCNLLHSSFMVRTNQLFNKLTKIENYYYLSGLLIGHELQDFPVAFSGNITLAGKPALNELYLAAFRVAGVDKKASVTVKNADEITLRGQLEVFKHVKKQKA